MTYYLTVEQVLFIHSRLVTEIGGSHGVRDLGLLESAILRAQGTFDGKDLYPTTTLKAAAMLHSLLLNRPFVDGNKRTAITATGIFLLRNKVKLVASNPDLENMVLEIVITKKTIEEISLWLSSHSQEI